MYFLSSGVKGLTAETEKSTSELLQMPILDCLGLNIGEVTVICFFENL